MVEKQLVTYRNRMLRVELEELRLHVLPLEELDDLVVVGDAQHLAGGRHGPAGGGQVDPVDGQRHF